MPKAPSKGDNASKVTKPRPDFAYNCDPCKRRKARCNRIKPCANCILHDCEQDCYTQASTTGPSEVPDNPPHHTPNPYGWFGPRVTTHTDEATMSAMPTNIRSVLPPAFQTPSLTRHITRESTLTSDAHNDSMSLKASMAFALPATALCDALLGFADSLLAEASFLNIEALRNTVLRISTQQGSSPRQDCMLFWTLAFAAQSIPSEHRLAKTYIHMGKSNEHWKGLALQIQATLPEADDDAEEMLLDVCIPTMQALWHGKYGQVRQAWMAVGNGIRRAAAMHLFEISLDASATEHARRKERGFLAAHRLLLMDRWMAFNNLCPLGIARDDLDTIDGPFNVEAITEAANIAMIPLHCPDLWSVRVCLEQVQVVLFENGRKIRRESRSMSQSRFEKDQMYAQISAYLSSIDYFALSAEALLCRELDLKGQTSPQELIRYPLEAMFQVAEWRAACAYIACVTCLSFSQDLDAPVDIRMASKRYALQLLGLSPVFTKIICSDLIPLSMTRICNQLFSAFRAIFASRGSRDLLGSERTELLGGDTSSSLSHASNIRSNPGQIANGGTNIETLGDGVTSSMLHDGINCIEEMHRRGSPIATRVLQLVTEARNRHPNLFQSDANSNGAYTAINGGGMASDKLSGETNRPFFPQQTSDFTQLVEAFMGPTNEADQLTQLQQMDQLLASFLDDISPGEGAALTW